MLKQVCYVISIASVVLSAILGVISVWFENLLPDGFVGRSLTTLLIIFAAAVVAAVVTGLNNKFETNITTNNLRVK